MSVYDRWYRLEAQPDGARRRVRSADYGCEKRWQVRWRDETGTQRKLSFERKADAARLAAQVKSQLAAGTYVDPSAGQVTFTEYAEDWRKSRVHDLPTAERIEREFRLHACAALDTPGVTPTGAPAIGHQSLRKLARQPSLVQAWIGGLKLHPNSARLVIKDVSQVFAAAADDGIISRNPFKAASVQRPKPVQSEAIPWAYAQVAAVAGNLPAHLAALPYLGVGCGQRQGELFAAALDDLDFLRRTAHVEYQIRRAGGKLVFAWVKNRKTRDVPLPDPVIPVLSEHVRLHPPVPVTLPWLKPGGKPVTRRLLFTRPDGSALPHNWFNHRWQSAWRAAGIPGDDSRRNGCHVLRHTAASAWLSRGLSIAKVAEYLGDTKEVVLATYAHFMPDDDDRARKIMNEFFSGPCALNVPAEAME